MEIRGLMELLYLIVFSGNNKINLSMKNFGISYYEKNFKKNMIELKRYLSVLLKNSKLLTAKCAIVFKKYPSDKSCLWNQNFGCATIK